MSLCRGCERVWGNGQLGVSYSYLSSSLPDLDERRAKIVELAEGDSAASSTFSIPFGTPLFEPQPPIVFFVGYESAETYEAVVKLR